MSIQRLQQTAGNQAVVRLLAAHRGPLVQRFSLTSSDLNRAGGRQVSAYFGWGTSEYSAISKTLADYERCLAVGTPAARTRGADLLLQLDQLCERWLAGDEAQDPARRGAIKALLDELPPERAALSNKQSQAVYLDNLRSEGSPAHDLKLATGKAQTAGDNSLDHYAKELAYAREDAKSGDPQDIEKLQQLEARMKLVREKGLTPAEHTSITAYTAEDYKYINPATANSPGWMAGAITRNQYQTDLAVAAPDRGFGRRGGDLASGEEDAAFRGHRGGEDQTFKLTEEERMLKALREEGSLHTGVITAGLMKLDPYHGLSYRGETMSEEEFRSRVAVGASATRPNLLSTGKGWSVALDFAAGNIRNGTDIAVFWLFDHGSGDSGGRDVSALSAVASEGEVLIMAGSPFKVRSVVEVGDPNGERMAGGHGDFYKSIQKSEVMEFAHKVYLVHVVATPKARGKSHAPKFGHEGGYQR